MARIEVSAALKPAEATEVLELVAAMTAADGVKPVSEHVILRVRNGGSVVGRHVLSRGADGELTGYAYLDKPDAESAVAELAVADRSAAITLIDAVTAEAGPSVRLWARGQSSMLAAVLSEHGYRTDRVLLQLRRSLADVLPEPVWPAGVRVRTFEPHHDEAAWLAVNNESFAAHPDQSGWTLDDIAEREREPWFDPAGFFLAERAGELVGFHWTKVHPHDSAPGSNGEPIGEVYVVGVAPSMQGQRLGSALTLVGIRHLQASGLRTVMLYVDASNPSAVHVYERLGFTRFDADTCFSRP